jgi:hydrogenase nickel incorporation protein HypB
MMAVRTIEVRERVMAKNDELAAEVRRRLAEARVPAFNLVSSPGAGKTLLLERTLQELGSRLRIAVVTGDVQTQNDADRLSRLTDQLVQAVVTGGACHLDAHRPPVRRERGEPGVPGELGPGRDGQAGAVLHYGG